MVSSKRAVEGWGGVAVSNPSISDREADPKSKR